jgi:hypothetical protein
MECKTNATKGAIMRALDKCRRSARQENSRYFQTVEYCLNEYGGLYDTEALWVKSAEDVAEWVTTSAERFSQGGERYLCAYVDEGRLFADTEKLHGGRTTPMKIVESSSTMGGRYFSYFTPEQGAVFEAETDSLMITDRMYLISADTLRFMMGRNTRGHHALLREFVSGERPHYMPGVAHRSRR